MDKGIHVVAAILISEDRILACRRAPHKVSGGLWEFPGGKVEAGEKVNDAITREIREELQIDITPVRVFSKTTTQVGDVNITLECILCEPIERLDLVSVDHDQLLWLPIDHLRTLDWTSPDLPIVENLLKLRHTLSL